MAHTLTKPAGLPVFPPHDDPAGDCVLRRSPGAPGIAWPPGFEGGILHRLDTSTSGAVLAADDLEELARIRSEMAGKSWVKTYRFLSARDVPWDTHTCAVELGHDRRHGGRMVPRRGQDTPHRGRWLPAETSFLRVRDRLWEARMRTGVMHQIRVHAAFVGIPILGDRQYGGGPTPQGAPPGVSFFLHHVGMAGPSGATSEVGLPDWAA